jgi:diaminopimelate epimerase
MSTPFVKMSGAGNDMILVDHRARFLAGREGAFAKGACDRRFGVGADGVILLEDSSRADFAVRFFNPDGGEYGLCGNGARCVPFFAAELGFPGPVHRFDSASGILEGEIVGPGRARVQLAPVGGIRLGVEAELDGRSVRLDFGAISDPHAVLWVEDVAAAPVERWGPALRRHPAFGPQGTNVSFARVRAPDRLEIRTFERGVEGETLACGSGSTVVATLARARGQVGRTVRMAVRSGDELTVHLPENPNGIPSLEGPVTRPFDGVLDGDLLSSPRRSR